jgi:hypothetical protein
MYYSLGQLVITIAAKLFSKVLVSYRCGANEGGGGGGGAPPTRLPMRLGIFDHSSFFFDFCGRTSSAHV